MLKSSSSECSPKINIKFEKLSEKPTKAEDCRKSEAAGKLGRAEAKNNIWRLSHFSTSM